MKRTQLIVIGAVLALAACGQPNAPPVEQAPAQQSTQVAPTEPGAVYPSLEGDPNAQMPPGAEGGRGSAQTGATDVPTPPAP